MTFHPQTINFNRTRTKRYPFQSLCCFSLFDQRASNYENEARETLLNVMKISRRLCEIDHPSALSREIGYPVRAIHPSVCPSADAYLASFPTLDCRLHFPDPTVPVNLPRPGLRFYLLAKQGRDPVTHILRQILAGN